MFRICGDAWDFANQPGDEHFGEGWMMGYAVFDSDTVPAEGMPIRLDGVDYTLARSSEVAPEEAPDQCSRGLGPGETVIALVLTPA